MSAEATSRNGIPTVYKGIQFRSRLEARWAAFFDLLGWRYQYEPFDLDGWIPDFLIVDTKVLIEVKPTTHLPTDVALKIERALPVDYEAVVLGCVVPVDQTCRFSLVPGQDGKIVYSPMIIECSDGIPIGWMLAKPPQWRSQVVPHWGLALIQRFREDPSGLVETEDYEWILNPFPKDCGIRLFHSHDHQMRCDPGQNPPSEDLMDFALSRFLGGFEHKPIYWGIMNDEVKSFWNQAGNFTQWKGKQAISGH